MASSLIKFKLCASIKNLLHLQVRRGQMYGKTEGWQLAMLNVAEHNNEIKIYLSTTFASSILATFHKTCIPVSSNNAII